MNNQANKKPKDYTEGSIFGSIIKMGLPSMFGFLVQHVYIMVDTWWVSRLPDAEAAVAALTFVGNIVWVLFSFNQLVGPGSVAIISRRYGEKEYDRTETAIKEAILLKLFFGLLLGVAGYILCEKLLLLLGAEASAVALGIEYGQIMFLAMPVLYATYTIFTAMRGVANPQMAFMLMLVSNLLNMALDPLLMFGYLGFPALGIKGAAFASAISFALTFLIGLGLFTRGYTNVKLHFSGRINISVASMWRMVKIGVPAWLGDTSFSGARMVIMTMVAPFGTGVVAAYGVANQISAFGIMVLVGIGLGLSSLIGHNLGSNKIDRARKTGNQAVVMGGVFMVVFGIAVFTFAGYIMSLFFDSVETIAIGKRILQILAIGFPATGAFIIMEEIYMGVGLNTPTMIFNIIHSWFLEVGPIYLLTAYLGFDVTAIWWTISLAGILTATAFYIYYRQGSWLTHQV